MQVDASITARRDAGTRPDLRPEERGENLAIFAEAFEVYRATWPEPVRQYFADLTGHTYEAFNDALTVLGEALYEGSVDPRPTPSMITPECFVGETGDE